MKSCHPGQEHKFRTRYLCLPTHLLRAQHHNTMASSFNAPYSGQVSASGSLPTEGMLNMTGSLPVTGELPISAEIPLGGA